MSRSAVLNRGSHGLPRWYVKPHQRVHEILVIPHEAKMLVGIEHMSFEILAIMLWYISQWYEKLYVNNLSSDICSNTLGEKVNMILEFIPVH
jgi:hypothetical protein